jgi:hypothetical protein
MYSKSNINSAIPRQGSVILIKAKESNGVTKLFATYVTGGIVLPHGATMLFLENNFFRIVKRDGQMIPVKTSFLGDPQLKKALNLTSPNKIGIVLNNNKTPFHWITLKHTNIRTAIQEIEPALLNSEYLFESALDQANLEEIQNQFCLDIAKSFFRELLGQRAGILILEKDISDTDQIINDEAAKEEESGRYDIEFDWDAHFKILPYSNKFEPYQQLLGDTKEVDLDLYFSSYAAVETRLDRGSYWEPPSFDVDVIGISGILSQIFVNGLECQPDDELTDLIKSAVVGKIEDDYSFDVVLKKIKKFHHF